MNSQVTEKTISTGKTPNVIKLNKLQRIHKSQRKQLDWESKSQILYQNLNKKNILYYYDFISLKINIKRICF